MFEQLDQPHQVGREVVGVKESARKKKKKKKVGCTTQDKLQMTCRTKHSGCQSNLCAKFTTGKKEEAAGHP